MTVSFKLNHDLSLKQYTDAVDKQVIKYNGPESFEKLDCRNCGHTLISGDLKLKQAPSQNMGNILELWQCHEESYDRLINSQTQKPVIKDKTMLFDFNLVLISKSILPKFEGYNCENCNHLLIAPKLPGEESNSDFHKFFASNLSPISFDIAKSLR